MQTDLSCLLFNAKILKIYTRDVTNLEKKNQELFIIRCKMHVLFSFHLFLALVSNENN